MNIRNCSKCGKIFNYVTGKPVCPKCRKSLEEKFVITRRYIKDNPSTSIADISQECEVDTKQIKQWVREERLSFSEGSSIGIECEVCGKSVKTGRFCPDCKSAMTEDLKSVYVAEEKPVENPFARKQTSKMRFMESRKKR